MLLDTSWRKGVQDRLLERAQEDSMKTPQDVKKLVNTQFNEFSEPINKFTKIIENQDFYRYKAYDRAMDVEFSNSKIIFYRVMFSAEGKEVSKEHVAELTHNGRVFVHIIGNGQPDEYVNTPKVENIMYKCFCFGIVLRK
ncbi:hypothetical protein [Vallitalea guaymasensis]|uniref:hypothetical protein n=1 Tax=Vallitalea guaymasensis TaxID=1185412 RepID=UPI000DE27014|nr:hypothetical protein [Vallitalea guaymasensis]